jgi:hypothetical protein
MSKTLYADGQTGKVAIMEGDLDMNVVNNPVPNSHKLYFHSDFNYLQLAHRWTGDFTCRAVPAGTYHRFAEKEFYFYWDIEDPFFILSKIDGYTVFQSFPIQPPTAQTNRDLDILATETGDHLGKKVRIFLGHSVGTIVALPAVTLSYEVNVFLPSEKSGNKNIEITGTSVSFGRELFMEQKRILRQGEGFKFPVSDTYTVTQSGNSFNLDVQKEPPVYIGLTI